MTNFLDNASYALLCAIPIALLAFIAWLNIWWHKQWKNMTPEERRQFKDEYRNGGDW